MTVTHELRATVQGPVRPKIVRIRTDLSWREVVLNAQKEKQFMEGIRRDKGKSEEGGKKGKGRDTN